MATGRAPRLVVGDRTAKILVTEFLAGELVFGSRAQECLDTFRQAALRLRVAAGIRNPEVADPDLRVNLGQRGGWTN
jgi:hypothetical protein